MERENTTFSKVVDLIHSIRHSEEFDIQHKDVVNSLTKMMG
jgi:hypothetical protein